MVHAPGTGGALTRMSPEGLTILRNLQRVEAERAARRADSGLDARVMAVKRFQHARFERTYQDLLASPRYRRSAQFFLWDLYGPHDFADRDAQFARVVPGLVRLFPHDVVQTVGSLSELHALSEELDTAMARALGGAAIDALQYVAAWLQVGRSGDRGRQIDLMLEIGRAIERYTRNPLLRHSLRLMRTPARAAGLSALQIFLESGFDTFREMRGSAEFLSIVEQRERALVLDLFGADPRSLGTALIRVLDGGP